MPRCAQRRKCHIYWIPRHRDFRGWGGPTLLIGDVDRHYYAICFSVYTKSITLYEAYESGLEGPWYSSWNPSEDLYIVGILRNWHGVGKVSEETLEAASRQILSSPGHVLAAKLRGLPSQILQQEAGRLPRLWTTLR